VLVFTPNFFGSIAPTHDVSNDYYYQKVAPVAEMARPGGLLVIGHWWILHGYAQRYTEADLLVLVNTYRSYTPDELAQRTSQIRRAIEPGLAGGRSVFISEEAVTLEPQVIQACGDRFIQETRLLWDDSRGDWHELNYEANTLYLLRTPVSGPWP
jgi:hypothetical protein